MYGLAKNTDINGKLVSWSVISHTLLDDYEVIAEYLYFDSARAHMEKLQNQWINQVKENAK
jgi:hypothetical protein